MSGEDDDDGGGKIFFWTLCTFLGNCPLWHDSRVVSTVKGDSKAALKVCFKLTVNCNLNLIYGIFPEIVFFFSDTMNLVFYNSELIENYYCHNYWL
jgi:hypothetical protein